jgi:hypothetical protein
MWLLTLRYPNKNSVCISHFLHECWRNNFTSNIPRLGMRILRPGQSTSQLRGMLDNDKLIQKRLLCEVPRQSSPTGALETSGKDVTRGTFNIVMTNDNTSVCSRFWKSTIKNLCLYRTAHQCLKAPFNSRGKINHD